MFSLSAIRIFACDATHRREKRKTHNNNWRKIKDVDDVEKKRTCEREREIMVTGNKNNVSSDDKWQEQKRKKEREREREREIWID